MPESGGLDRFVTHARLEKLGQIFSQAASLSTLGEVTTRFRGLEEALHEYFRQEQFAISAMLDNVIRRVNELPEMIWLPFGLNVVASMSSVQMNGALSQSGYVAVEEGSIIGLGVRTDDARTAGTLTIEPRINGVATGFTLTLDGSNTTFNTTLQDQGTDIFARGDRIDLIVTTTADYAPADQEIMVSVGIVVARGVR